jgi:hypothetical protein
MELLLGCILESRSEATEDVGRAADGSVSGLDFGRRSPSQLERSNQPTRRGTPHSGQPFEAPDVGGGKATQCRIVETEVGRDTRRRGGVGATADQK